MSGRLLLSLGALAVAVAICAYERHFSLSLADPRTFLLALDHRCGWMLLLSALWVAAEALALGARRLGLTP